MSVKTNWAPRRFGCIFISRVVFARNKVPAKSKTPHPTYNTFFNWYLLLFSTTIKPGSYSSSFIIFQFQPRSNVHLPILCSCLNLAITFPDEKFPHIRLKRANITWMRLCNDPPSYGKFNAVVRSGVMRAPHSNRLFFRIITRPHVSALERFQNTIRLFPNW